MLANPTGVYGIGTRLEIDFQVPFSEGINPETGLETTETALFVLKAIVFQKKEAKTIIDLSITDQNQIYVEGSIVDPDPFSYFNKLTAGTVYKCRLFYSLDEEDRTHSLVSFQLLPRLDNPIERSLVGQRIRGYLAFSVTWGENND